MRGAFENFLFMLLVGAFAAVWGGVADAAPRPPSDAACLLVSNVLAKHPTDAKQREKVIPVLTYYFGRVDAQLSGGELKKVLEAEERVLKSAKASTLMNDCARNMVARQKIFNEIAKQAETAK